MVFALLSAVVVSAKSFVHGGSIEELSLGILAYAIYSLLHFLREKDGKMPKTSVFFNGIWAGVFFWSKFSLLGLYFVWILAILRVCLRRKQFRDFRRCLGAFGGGFLAATVPWIIYFGICHGTGEWLNVYIWNNIFGYTSGEKSGICSRIYGAVRNAIDSLKDRGNRCYSLPVALGCIGYVCLPSGKVSWAEKLWAAGMGAGLALGIFIGGTKHYYYGLPLAVFLMFAGVDAGMLWKLASDKWKVLGGKICLAVLFLAASAVGTTGAFFKSPNVYLMSVKQEEMPQYRFAERINGSADSTVLNYGFLDGGFYTVLRQVPTVPVFCVTNLHPDRQIAQQNLYVENRKTHWLVTWKAFPVSEEELENLPVVSEYYALKEYQYFYFEGDLRTYALYEVKDSEEIP